MTNGIGPELFDACFAEDVDRVRELIRSGAADALAWRKPGSLWSPLHAAAEQCNLAVVQELVAAGAPLHARDANGWTPLHLAVDAEIDAATQGDTDLALSVTAFLLRSGADPNAVANDGRTPINVAQAHSCVEAEVLLASKPGSGGRE